MILNLKYYDIEHISAHITLRNNNNEFKYHGNYIGRAFENRKLIFNVLGSKHHFFTISL